MTYNLISVLIVVIVAVSVVQGYFRGASGSTRRLMSLAAEGALTVVSAVVAWKLAGVLSPVVQSWLEVERITIPKEDMGAFRQFYYTFVTGIRDFPLLRFGTLFAIGYIACKLILYPLWGAVMALARRIGGPLDRLGRASPTASSVIGGLIGFVIGCARALFLIVCLFVYSALFPGSPFTQYVKQSGLYMYGTTRVIAPFSGDWLAEQLPVFTKAVEQEFKQILRRKYEIIDAVIPADIAEAAERIVAGKKSDEAKARALYHWVGTRIQYDWDKVDLYETKRIWKEQSPEETFATRKGVCIDYARLYAVMARSVGLEARVVTGLGYDGRGGFGPHAWNEVYLKEKGQWVPLDPTWVASGGNWFNPPNFDKTHIKEA